MDASHATHPASSTASSTSATAGARPAPATRRDIRLADTANDVQQRRHRDHLPAEEEREDAEEHQPNERHLSRWHAPDGRDGDALALHANGRRELVERARAFRPICATSWCLPWPTSTATKASRTASTAAEASRTSASACTCASASPAAAPLTGGHRPRVVVRDDLAVDDEHHCVSERGGAEWRTAIGAVCLGLPSFFFWVVSSGELLFVVVALAVVGARDRCCCTRY